MLSRRNFLRHGSLTAVAAGAVTAMPGLSALLAGTASEAPAVDAVVSDASLPALDSQLVAHVRDLGTGEIAVYHGSEEFIFHNPTMAARLFGATR